MRSPTFQCEQRRPNMGSPIHAEKRSNVISQRVGAAFAPFRPPPPAAPPSPLFLSRAAAGDARPSGRQGVKGRCDYSRERSHFFTPAAHACYIYVPPLFTPGSSPSRAASLCPEGGKAF